MAEDGGRTLECQVSREEGLGYPLGPDESILVRGHSWQPAS